MVLGNGSGGGEGPSTAIPGGLVFC